MKTIVKTCEKVWWMGHCQFRALTVGEKSCLRISAFQPCLAEVRSRGFHDSPSYSAPPGSPLNPSYLMILRPNLGLIKGDSNILSSSFHVLFHYKPHITSIYYIAVSIFFSVQWPRETQEGFTCVSLSLSLSLGSRVF